MEDLRDLSTGLKESVFEDEFAPDVDDVTLAIDEIPLLVAQTALLVDCVAAVVLGQHGIAAWVHLEVAEDPVDVEASEGEDLRDFALLPKLLLQEEDLALASTHMTISCHDVALLVHHESSLVDVDVSTLLVLSQQELDLAFLIAIEDAHDFLQLKSLTVVVEQFRHQTTELLELLVVEALDSVFVHNTALFVDKEALHRNESAKLVNVARAALALGKAERVLLILVEESAQQVERVEVVLFEGVGHRDVAALVKLAAGEDLSERSVVVNVARLLVDQVPVVVDRPAFLIECSLVAVLIHWHDNVAFVVAVKSAHDVDLVELAPVKVSCVHDGAVAEAGFIGSLEHTDPVRLVRLVRGGSIDCTVVSLRFLGRDSVDIGEELGRLFSEASIVGGQRQVWSHAMGLEPDRVVERIFFLGRLD